MTRRRDRDRRPARREAFRDVRKRILVVCEGKVTEPGYLRTFATASRNPLVDVEIAREHGVPLTLVIRAKELREQPATTSTPDPNLSYDEVWCVFDTDEHPHIPEAKNMASQNEIELAISNPSFELWLLLHFRDPPGAQHRDRIREMLKGHLPNYGKRVDFRDFQAGYRQAVNRASQLDELAQQIGDAGRNPTTGIYRLTERIRGDQSVLG
jgi:hypothetical protein